MKYFLIALACVVVAVGGFFLIRFLQHPAQIVVESPQTPTDDLASTVWVEVVSGGVFYTAPATGATEAVVSSGDIVGTGGVLRTDTTGKAIIHFPDSSFASLDTGTRLTISETSYDPTTQSLVAKLFLSSGRVWSKIFDLATPTSAWEVKTSNAVATVRGTAFGMEYSNKTSRVLGSQHTVRVVPISKNVMTKAQVDVKEDEQVEISDAQADAIASGKVAPVSFMTPKRIDTARDMWASAGKKEEVKFETELQRLKTDGEQNPKQLRVKMRMLFEKPFREKIRTRILETQNSTTPTPSVNEPTSDNSGVKPAGTPTGTPQPTTASTTTSTTASAKIVLTTKADLSSVTAGSIVNFSAIVVRSDGSRQDVTGAAAWKVVGDIGTFPKPGTFQPSLIGAATELEKAPGAVVVSYDDPKTRTTLSAKSEIFYVQNSPNDPTAIAPLGT